MQNELRENLEGIRRRVEQAAGRAGRRAEEIKLICVSKTHPTAVLREAMSAGARVFGENKVQEAEGKIREIGRENCEWHLIGHLQSNKARRAVQLFDVIHTLDSADLAARLDRLCAEDGRENLRVLIQVDLAREETKAGVSEEDLPALVEFMQSCAHLRLTGLMALPPFYEDVERVRPFFRRLRELRDGLASKGAFAGGSGGGELSMGMSHDFETAIEEGATLIRVGTAIFGERNYSAAR